MGGRGCVGWACSSCRVLIDQKGLPFALIILTHAKALTHRHRRPAASASAHLANTPPLIHRKDQHIRDYETHRHAPRYHPLLAVPQLRFEHHRALDVFVGVDRLHQFRKTRLTGGLKVTEPGLSSYVCEDALSRSTISAYIWAPGARWTPDASKSRSSMASYRDPSTND